MTCRLSARNSCLTHVRRTELAHIGRRRPLRLRRYSSTVNKYAWVGDIDRGESHAPPSHGQAGMSLLSDRAEANKEIGRRVHGLMRQKFYTHEQLADRLGITRQQVSKRLSGAIKWPAVEVSIVAAWLGVPIADLVPEIARTDRTDDAPVMVPWEELRNLPKGSVVVIGR